MKTFHSGIFQEFGNKLTVSTLFWFVLAKFWLKVAENKIKCNFWPFKIFTMNFRAKIFLFKNSFSSCFLIKIYWFYPNYGKFFTGIKEIVKKFKNIDILKFYCFISKIIFKNYRIWWKLIDFKQKQSKKPFLNKKKFCSKIHSFGP